MANNQATTFIDQTKVAEGVLRVPAADWVGGMNPAASNAPVIGVSTAVIDPTEENWPRPVSEVIQTSQSIGGTPQELFVIDAIFGADSLVAFVQATAPVLPDGIISVVGGFNMINRTGATIPTNAWVWGVANNP